MNLFHRLILHPILADSHAPVFYVIMVPIGALGFTLLFISVSLYFQNKERQRRHETARIAMEKGQPVPSFAEVGVFADPRLARQRSWIGLLIAGLINVALGIGLYFMLSSIPGAYVVRSCSAIPGLIGVALLVSALIVALVSRTKSDTGDRSPMS